MGTRLRRLSAACAGTFTVVSLLAAPQLTSTAEATQIQDLQAKPGAWSPTGSMARPRSSPAAVLLNNGKVLVTGGLWCNFSSCGAATSSELYDPATGAWTATGSLIGARFGAQALLLPSGKALVIGGSSVEVEPTPQPQLYDPITGTFSSGGTMVAQRFGFPAVVLTDGTVLVGACCRDTDPAATQIYDPSTNTWSAGAPMGTARSGASATVLPSGKVLVAGGQDGDAEPLATAELYDPATKTWAPAASMTDARVSADAALTPDGTVLVSGGCLPTSEVYDPVADTWTSYHTDAPVASGDHQSHTQVFLSDGTLLVQGGTCTSRTGRRYDWSTDAWLRSAKLTTERLDHAMIRLQNGNVLATGGFHSGEEWGVYLDTAELYRPGARATAYAAPNPVRQGAALTLGASGFRSGEIVQFTVGRHVVATAAANDDGALTASVTAQAVRPRPYVAVAEGQTSGRRAYFQLLVTSA